MEPFTVKNLENVQGDERDYIFVSTLFGPNKDKVTMQRFGPINHPKGHRRLNVLFTRAKEGLKLFTSLTPNSVREGGEKLLVKSEEEYTSPISKIYKVEKEYIIKISSRKITEELFKKINIDNNEQRLTALRALDKIDRLGWNGVKQLLGEGRKDKSGDFTKGANLGSSNIAIVEKELNKKSPDTDDLLEIFKIFKDYGFDNFKFDPSIIRGLEYYTGPIFEVSLKFDVKNNKGQVIQFGSIGGGGRYDNLVNNFGNYDAPATGISIGLDRLVYALMQKKEFKVKQSKPVVICVFDKNSMKDYINVQTILRKAGVSTEIYPGESKLKKQMEYANKIKSPAVILYGENEIKSGKPTLRNLSSGEEKSIEIKELVNEIKKIIWSNN